MNLNEKTNKITATIEGGVPLEITAKAKNNTAYFTIKGSIYEWTAASTTNLSGIISAFKNDGIKDAEVYLSSGGGDVFEADDLINIIDESFDTVKIKGGAVIASAATRFCTKWYTVAKVNTQLMIHKPMGNPRGNEDQIEAGLKLIKDKTKEYKAAYASKMKTAEAEIEKLWGKGDYWMTAKEALELGLVDEIEDEEDTIDATTHLQLVACGAPIIPKVENTNNQNKNNHMELSVLAVSIGLPATATQEQVNERLETLKTKAATADGLVQAAADKEEADKKAEKKKILDAAEQEHKINAKQRPMLEKLEIVDIKAFLEDQPNIDALSEGIQSKGGETPKGREAWTYADYQEKDPAAFDKLDAKSQNALIEAFYKED